MNKDEKLFLKEMARRIRIHIIESTYAAKSGHPGGSLSCADLITYLYFKEMHIDPKHPEAPDRDRFVLSKGHCAPALYGALAEKGFFDPAELFRLRHIGSFLQGHPSRKDVPGVDMSTGSLGQGISAACGMALGLKVQKKTGPGAPRVYALLGDGEIAEGEVWEAMMFAAHYALDNLMIFIDNNGLQIDGAIEEVMSPYPIDEKLEAFGWSVETIDGHDFEAIEAAVERAKAVQGRPSAIILKTVKGKGVSFMENQAGWHGKAPNEEQMKTALAELSKEEVEA